VTTLAAEALHFAYGEAAVLSGVDLSLAPGTLTLLAGRNGAGKSTLLNLLAGIERAAAGAVRIDGQDIHGLGSLARARAVTLIPQESDTSFEFTGREVVMMGRHPHISRFASPSAGDHDEVERALRITDSSRFADRSVRTLSGGELRRIHIARALATRAPVLLADEPLANLDLEHAVSILGLLRQLATAGHTVLLSAHDLNLIAPRCDAVALLHEGRIHSVGPATEVLSDTVFREVFGVESRAPSGYFPRDFEGL
jgi:iron complex transport system ATP-binding protein